MNVQFRPNYKRLILNYMDILFSTFLTFAAIPPEKETIW